MSELRISDATNAVPVSRRRSVSAGAALLLVVLTAAGIASAVTHGTGVGIVIALVLFGVPASAFMRSALSKRPVFLLDERGLTLGRSQRLIQWSDVVRIQLAHQRGVFGRTHHLMLTLRTPERAPQRRIVVTNATADDEIDIALDWLSLPWSGVVETVERASGRTVVQVHEQAFGHRAK